MKMSSTNLVSSKVFNVLIKIRIELCTSDNEYSNDNSLTYEVWQIKQGKINMIDKENRAIGSLVGLAVGDALGTTLEFMPRDTYPVLTDMIGGGAFDLKPGQWTDDTSLALCLGESLNFIQGFDPYDQLSRYYNWLHYGYKSSTGTCFDVGHSTHCAIADFKRHGTILHNPELNSAGNGSLMRLAPIPIFYCTEEKYSHEFADLLKFTRLSSATTHAGELAVESCVAYSIMINRAILGYDYMDVVRMTPESANSFGITNRRVKQAVNPAYYMPKERDEIKSTGYVIDSIEAALWCFSKTTNFEDAVLLAANLGDDADTVAAITGQLAGAYYGLDGIPQKWIDTITDSDEIIELATKLYNRKK